MDCYYAAIEALDNPSLKGLPIVVGGSPESRGVVATASYEARKFGIKSAMPTATAYRLCPHAVFLRPRFDRYVEISEQIRAVFHRHTDLVEPLSLDEAYLDVTNNAAGKYAVAIAKEIRAAIFAETKLTASAGVAPNKLVAKIASDVRKPNGLTVVLPEQVAAFMRDMPLKRIHGVGPVTASRLAEHGLHLCRDAVAMGEARLEELFGNLGPWLYEQAQGLDERPVETDHVRKSLGTENTFPRDLYELEAMDAELKRLAAEISAELKDRGIKGRTITVKVRYNDFRRITRAATLPDAVDDEPTIYAKAAELLRKSDAARIPVRLLGISLSKLED
jgi:DNA polymerase-4